MRQLENAIERAVVLATGAVITREAVTIEETDAPARSHMPFLTLRQNVEWIERQTIERALATSSLKRHAARMLGITPPRALSYYPAKYRVEAES